MEKQLKPREANPGGHLRVARAMKTLAEVLAAKQELSDAASLHHEALAIYERLHLDGSSGGAHLGFLFSLSSLGLIHRAQGDAESACDVLLRCNELSHSRAEKLLPSVPEVEALNIVSLNAALRAVLISAWAQTARSPDDLFAVVWRGERMLARAKFERHRLFFARPSADLTPLVESYKDVQRQLAMLAMAPGDADRTRLADRRLRLSELADKKERLEGDLAHEIPVAASQQVLLRRPYTDLQKQLPRDAVLVQFAVYSSGKPGLKGGVAAFTAFMVAPSRPARMVDLGPVAAIDAAVRSWREAIADERKTDVPVALRRLVWEPIEKNLPAGTTTVYLTVDGPLTAIPWAALPGKVAGSVLLEEYALSLVPYGPFLLDQLSTEKRAASAEDILLAVGGVSYNDQPTSQTDSAQLAALRGEAALEGQSVRWTELPGTHEEVNSLSALGGNRKTTVLSSRDASADRVVAELPKARWAVFATHGFFADPKLRSALRLDDSNFENRNFVALGPRTTPAGRNPLLLSGLVLAGANVPRRTNEFGIPQGDGGILTAEVIASLPLDKLDLVVLSACDTALGEVAGGEGVFGLQRAFHQAGAANVVASLWKIDDSAAAALMRLFYYKVFRENKPPLLALREAQLTIYRHPEQICHLASARAPEFDKAAKLADGGKITAPAGRAATRLWAGFVLSGAGK